MEIRKVFASDFNKERIEHFKRDARKLFDMAECKYSTFYTCTCPKEKKVPTEERNFLDDERKDRRLAIRYEDHAASKKMEKGLERKL